MVFMVILLNVQDQIIDVEDLFKGILTANAIYPRDVIKSAIKHNAASLIFVHNHPSGNPEPNGSDEAMTRDLVIAGKVM